MAARLPSSAPREGADKVTGESGRRSMVENGDGRWFDDRQGVHGMDPKERKYETVVARRLILTDEEWAAQAEAINRADERDGTLEFLDAMLDDVLEGEPDYEW